MTVKRNRPYAEDVSSMTIEKGHIPTNNMCQRPSGHFDVYIYTYIFATELSCNVDIVEDDFTRILQFHDFSPRCVESY